MTNNLTEIAGRRILVTGINGFIGCNLAVVAQNSDADVYGIDLPGTSGNADKIRYSLISSPKQITVNEVESLDREYFKNIISEHRVDIVIHLAGDTSRNYDHSKWAKSIESNVSPVLSLLTAIAEMPDSDRPVLIIPGSQMEYGLAPMPWAESRLAMPVNAYGVSKLLATDLILAAVRTGIVKASVIRLPLVFGPGQNLTMVVPEIICKALMGIDIPMTEGRQQRRFVFVNDVAVFILKMANLLCTENAVPPLVNAIANEPVSIADIAQKTIKLIESKAKLKMGALSSRGDELMQAWPDTSLADSMKLINVTSLDKALSDTVDWYKENDWFTSMVSLTN